MQHDDCMQDKVTCIRFQMLNNYIAVEDTVRSSKVFCMQQANWAICYFIGKNINQLFSMHDTFVIFLD